MREEEEDALERRRASVAGRWGQKEKRAYRFASSAGPRGRREKRIWAVEKRKRGPAPLKDFPFKVNSTLLGVLWSKKKNQIT